MITLFIIIVDLFKNSRSGIEIKYRLLRKLLHLKNKLLSEEYQMNIKQSNKYECNSHKEKSIEKILKYICHYLILSDR